jgi:hypothetical protein
VARGVTGKRMRDMNVTLYAQEAKGDKFYLTKTDSAGRYYLDGLVLFGNQKIQLTTRNKQGKKEGMLLMDSLMGQPLQAIKMSATNDTTALLQQFWKAALARSSAMKKRNITDTAELAEVIVKQARTKTVVLRNQVLMAYGNEDTSYTITAADHSYNGLQHFLTHRVAGAIADDENNGIYFYADGKKVRPRFIVDRQEDVFERLDYYDLPLDKIEKITIRHMLSTESMHVYLIYLTLKPGAFDRPDLSLLNANVAGYYEARVFYAPFYSQTDIDNNKTDVRTTIHWAPDIVTDANGKATIRFHNASIPTHIRVVAEGITQNGMPVTSTIQYQVK